MADKKRKEEIEKKEKIEKTENKKVKKEKKTSKKKGKLLIIILLSVILIASIAYMVFYFVNQSKNENSYDDLYEKIEENTVSENAEGNVGQEYVDTVIDLRKENEDVKGWIKIDDTNINYPLLQSADNNDYYLNHNYKKEKTSYGSIYLNYKSDIKNPNSNLIIYGHDMKDGQMFKDLLKYTNKEFYDNHSIVKIATDESYAEYQIIFAFKSRVFYQDEKNVFRYYQYYDFENEEKYNEYLDNCRKIQLYDTGVTANYGDQLITMITCEYSQENGRMVVVAKKINNEIE